MLFGQAQRKIERRFTSRAALEININLSCSGSKSLPDFPTKAIQIMQNIVQHCGVYLHSLARHVHCIFAENIAKQSCMHGSGNN